MKEMEDRKKEVGKQSSGTWEKNEVHGVKHEEKEQDGRKLRAGWSMKEGKRMKDESKNLKVG